jgi:hypothetical protein
MKSHNTRLCVEELDSRTLPSTTPLAPPGLAEALAHRTSTRHVHGLAGTITGTYTIGHDIPDTGMSYRFTGAGTVGLLGAVTATASLRTTGFIEQGRAGGALTLSNAQGTLTLRLQGPVQRGFAALPQHFHFTVSGGTGAFQGLAGGGMVTLRLNPLAQPLLASAGAVTSLPIIGGTFTLRIRSDVVPPPWATQTGLEGVALVGPIAPVVRPGVPDSRPLPQAIITVQPAGGGAEIARVRTDANGQFRLRLEPGTYLIVPLPPKPGQFLPRGIPQTVTVPKDGFAGIVVNYDSGIR